VKVELIRRPEDVLKLLDEFFPDEEARWNKFFATLPVAHPLSSLLPDESLVEFVEQKKILRPGCAIDIGCGNGRNAVYLAKQGFKVDAVDLSLEVLKKGIEFARASDVPVSFQCGSFFDMDLEPQRYDLVCDSGLLHHVFPHRRPQYLDRVRRLLKPDGHLVLVTFNEKMGTSAPDWQLYEQRSLEGGMSFPQAKLEALFDGIFELIEYRPMRNCLPSDGCFGHDFVSISLWQRSSECQT
jgi:SAM-dependent methyltransferase